MERARDAKDGLCARLRLEDSRPESIPMMVEGKLGRRRSNEMAHSRREKVIRCSAVSVGITLDVVSVVPGGSSIGPAHSPPPSLQRTLAEALKDTIPTVEAICNSEPASPSRAQRTIVWLTGESLATADGHLDRGTILPACAFESRGSLHPARLLW